MGRPPCHGGPDQTLTQGRGSTASELGRELRHGRRDLGSFPTSAAQGGLHAPAGLEGLLYRCEMQTASECMRISAWCKLPGRRLVCPRQQPTALPHRNSGRAGLWSHLIEMVQRVVICQPVLYDGRPCHGVVIDTCRAPTWGWSNLATGSTACENGGAWWDSEPAPLSWAWRSSPGDISGSFQPATSQLSCKPTQPDRSGLWKFWTHEAKLNCQASYVYPSDGKGFMRQFVAGAKIDSRATVVHPL